MLQDSTSSTLGESNNSLTLLEKNSTQSLTANELQQLNLTVEYVTLHIPDADILSQAFEKVRALPNYLKPIVMEGLAKKLRVSKKTVDKAFEVWAMERISQIVAADAQRNNGEEVG